MTSNIVPPVVDIRDHLDRIRDDSPHVEDQVDSIATELTRLPGGESDASVIDQIDNMLLALELRVHGETEREVVTARNRLLTYRSNRRQQSAFLGHTEPCVVAPSSGKRTELSKLAGRTARLTTIVTNRGDARDVVVVVQISDEEGRILSQIITEETTVGVGEQQQVTATIFIPEDAEDVTLAAKNTTDQNTIGDLI